MPSPSTAGPSPSGSSAFLPGPRLRLAPTGEGPLSGLSFAVKDLIDVAGSVTGGGNPDWGRMHVPATRHAPAVAILLAAGAALEGKTITDKLAYSLNGDNVHYGTPRNSRAPDRVPGGSSSGSAAAVAAGLCDIALGTDTGGSIRIPASYCGLWGIRTSHGRISMDGVVPLMPSLDTIGWFAADPEHFAAVGPILLPLSNGAPARFTRLLLGDFAALASEPVAAALALLRERIEPWFERVEPWLVSGAELERWRRLFRCFSAAEAWQVHGAWIAANEPGFAPAIAARFAWAAQVPAADAAAARAERSRIAAGLEATLGRDALICLPTAPGPAPLLQADPAAVEGFRQQAQRLTCIAGMAGLPQISIPGTFVDGAPVGLSLIGPRGADEALLEIGVTLSQL